MKRGVPVVISAPSGGGKSTICQRLLLIDPCLKTSISCTTRAPRPGEKNHVHYHFLSPKEFRSRIKRGFFVEWANVHGNFYGTPRTEFEKLMREGFDVLLAIDTQGARSLRKLYPQTLSVFIAAPNWSEWMKRLKSRGISARDLRIRVKNAREELQQIPEYDHAIINDQLDDTVNKILSILRQSRGQRNTARTAGLSFSAKSH